MQQYDTVGCCHSDSLGGHLREGFPPPHCTQGFWVLLLLKKKKANTSRLEHSPLYFLSKSNFGFLPSRNLSLNPAQTLQLQEIVLPTASSVANVFYVFLKHCSCKNLSTTINRAVCFWCCVSTGSDMNPTVIMSHCWQWDPYLLAFKGAGPKWYHVLFFPSSTVVFLPYSMLLPSKASNKHNQKATKAQAYHAKEASYKLK